MKRIYLIGLFFLLMVSIFAKTAEDYISSAYAMEDEDIFKAIEIMEQASKDFPENVDVLSVYGLMVSKGSGQANLIKAGSMVYQAERIFDQALQIDINHKNTILWRGILRVNVPKFFNKLNKGIADLEKISKSPGLSNDDYLVTSYYLAFAYQKKGEDKKAIDYYKNIIRYGKDSQFYQDSLLQLQELTKTNAKELIPEDDYQSQADKFLEEGDYIQAYNSLTQATKQDTTNIDLYLKYLQVIRQVSENGYNENVYEDVAFMTDLAFNVAYALNRIVVLLPNSEDFRLLKAQVLSQLPFFVNSLEDAQEECLWIIENSKSDSNIELAKEIQRSILKRKTRKKLTDSFVASASQNEKQALVKDMQFDKSQAKRPETSHCQISLSLGFGDYIAPQTAIWVEDLQGNYIRSLYVSGFSANIKEKQVHLPRWAKKSEFENTIVRVTGASIDSGKHILYWDYKDSKGNLLTSGDYLIYAEVAHWPHANYSLQKVQVSLGDKSYLQVTKGDLVITELMVKY